MKVLMTGATGFIGRHVVRNLRARGAHIIAIRRTHTNVSKRTDDADADQVDWRNCGLNETERLRDLVFETKPTVCLHMAWFTEPGLYSEANQNLELVDSTLALIRIVGEAGCHRFVGVGSCAEYESLSVPLSEESSVKPLTLYGASKLACRYLGEAIARSYGMEFVWGRIFYVYGPGENGRRVVPAVVNTLLDGGSFAATTGEQVRDFLHVEDVASAFGHLCVTNAEGVFNVSSGQPMAMRELLETIAQEIGHPHAIRYGATAKHGFDPPYVVGDSTRLLQLGWRPRHTLQTGLQQTIRWWHEQRLAPGASQR